MTPQEAFDRAYLGVMKQGALAKSGRVCVYYNSDNGARCGIGHVVTLECAKQLTDGWVEDIDSALIDRREDGELDSSYATNGARMAREELAGLDVDWLAGLQASHDGAGNLEEYDRSMREFADREGLTVPSLEVEP